MGCGLLLLISFVHGQLLDALVDAKEDSHNPVRTRWPQRSSSSWLDYLSVLDRGGQKGTDKYKEVQKAHALALHDSFVAAGSEFMEMSCASIELRRTAEYAICLAIAAQAYESSHLFHMAALRYQESIVLSEELKLTGTTDFRTMVCNLGAVFYKSGERTKLLHHYKDVSKYLKLAER
jgi:hypothetical protein